HLSGTAGNPGWFTSASVDITLTATDAASSVASTYYTVDGGNRQTYSGPVTVSGEGSHVVTFWSADQAGNIEAARPDTSKTRTPPPTTLHLPGTPATPGWFTSPTVSIALTAADAASGVAATYYTIDGGLQKPYGGPLTVSGEGSHVVTFWSVDAAGNIEAAGS